MVVSVGRGTDYYLVERSVISPSLGQPFSHILPWRSMWSVNLLSALKNSQEVRKLAMYVVSLHRCFDTHGPIGQGSRARLHGGVRSRLVWGHQLCWSRAVRGFLSECFMRMLIMLVIFCTSVHYKLFSLGTLDQVVTCLINWILNINL